MVSNKILKKVIIILTIIVLIVITLYSALVDYISRYAKQDTKVKSDVILVLGEAAYSGTSCFGPRCQDRFVSHPHYNPCLVSRVNHAVALYKDNYASKILMSGGTDKEDGVNEAKVMKNIAVEDGVPEADIIMEKESTSTYENLALSQKILNEAGLHSVIIVTDAATNARAGLVASKLHYTYSLSPDNNTSCSHGGDYYVREPLAIIDYILSGKI